MRGEGLIPLCGRKYFPIKENELKVGCGGEREGGIMQLLAETIAFSGADFLEQQEERMRRMDGWIVG